MKRITLFACFIIISVYSFGQKPSKEQMEADKKRLAEAMKKLNETTSKMDPKAKSAYDSTLNVYGMGEKIKSATDQVNGKSPTPPKTAVGLAKDKSTELPVKQSLLLGGMPKINSESQYNDYLIGLKKKISDKVPQAFRNNIDVLLNKYRGNATALNNVPALFFMDQNPEASMYAAICVAIQNKAVPVSQENLTAILHLTGYPQYALPLLEYLNTKYKSDLLLSNAGHSYLSLGDKDKAKTYFMRALAANPGNVQANCGMGFIEANSTNPAAAAPYIEKVMKNGYSEMLDKMVTQKNIKLNYSAMKPVVPETFPPGKYKVRPSALKFEEVKEVTEKRLQINRVVNDWIRKLQQAQQTFDAATKNMSTSEKFALMSGYGSTVPLARKARFMVTQSEIYMNDFAMRTAPLYNALRLKIAKMQDDLKKENGQTRKDFPDSYEACQQMKESLNQYLAKTAEITDDYVVHHIDDFYDFTNQQLYWNRFLVNQDMYNLKFYELASSMVKAVNDYGNIQALDVANTVVYDCEHQAAATLPNLTTGDPDANCPFSIKIPFGVGSFKSNCKGWSLEGGEAAIVGISKNFQTGEFTVSMGMGGNIEAPFLGGSIGAQMFITVGSDFIPCDMGMQGNAGIEAAAGPVVIGEEGLTATMSIASGLNVDALHGGQQTNLLNLDPKKD